MDKKIMSKLMASMMALATTVALVVTTSYAWVTLAGSPEIQGIQVTLGGSDTILVAADMTVIGEDGQVYHYPGKFGTHINLLQYDSYTYLEELTGLMPVSTWDGTHWFLPQYYDASDPEVQNGQAVSGQLKDSSEFAIDSSLEQANLTEAEEAVSGHYIYMDFWVASPAAGYKLRVSTGSEEEGTGSYAVALPQPVETDTNGDGKPDGYTLEAAEEGAAASLRIGFLVNGEGAGTGAMLAYLNSEDSAAQYTALYGQYQSPGEDIALYGAATNRFTIFEPNGDMHEGEGSGNYQITRPLGLEQQRVVEKDIRDRLTVQKKSTWKLAADSTDTMLEQELQTALIGKKPEDNDEQSVREFFYKKRLGGQLAPYLHIGRFISRTDNLWVTAQAGGDIAEAESDAMSDVAGATTDVYITELKKNMPQRIRMFIWLEGQDPDCVNHGASNLAVHIELAGGSDS